MNKLFAFLVFPPPFSLNFLVVFGSLLIHLSHTTPVKTQRYFILKGTKLAPSIGGRRGLRRGDQSRIGTKPLNGQQSDEEPVQHLSKMLTVMN